MTSLGLLVLRLALAVVFVAHGSHTLFGAWPGPGQGPGGLAHEADLYTAAGLTPAMVLAVTAGVLQLAGGLLIGVGWFARWAAGALAIDTGIGLWKLHLQWGFFLNYANAPGRGHGIEYAVVLLGALLALVLAGSGDASIDGVRAKTAEARAAGRARLRGKV
jgi:putative oxidoreductase